MTLNLVHLVPLGSLPHPYLRTAARLLGGAALIALAVWAYCWPYRKWRSSLKNLPGPPSTSLLWGALPALFAAEPGVMHDAWSLSYGSTYRMPALLGTQRLVTTDLVALNYILVHADQAPKPPMTRRFLARMLGNGVLVAEGADHRRQRRVLNPSFSPQSIRDCLDVFYDKSEELREVLAGLVEGAGAEMGGMGNGGPGAPSPTPPKPEDVVKGARKIDVMKYLGMCTIDIIGIAGFSYDFEALSQPKNELAEAFREMFAAGQGVNIAALIQSLVPGASKIPTRRMRATAASKATTERIGRRLIEEKKRAIRATHAEGFEKADDIGKDLLSSCIRANMAADLRPEQKLSDDEVLAQITTFMLAGNETSSTALTWLLYLITQNPATQERLRAECLAVPTDRPSVEELHALPYLDAVVHEALRLRSPVNGTVREASEDFVLPLGTPIRGRDGRMVDNVQVKKGQGIFIPISTINTSPEIWGADAGDFRPERHLAPITINGSPPPVVPGVWGNVLTFIGGPRNCIGYRFALAEIKAILFVLIRGLTFETLPSNPTIERKSSVVMRPRVVGEEAAGLQMPLLVRVYNPTD